MQTNGIGKVPSRTTPQNMSFSVWWWLECSTSTTSMISSTASPPPPTGLEKWSLLVLGRRSISGLKRGSKCIIRSKRWWCRDTGGAYYEAHAVVRWFMTSRSVLPTLSRGLLVLWGWWEFSISPDIWRLTYYLVVITNSKIFSPDVTPGFASTRSRDTPLGT